MSWGRNNRLSRIFDPASGRTNMLAVDHGYFLGPITGMEAPRTAIAPLLPSARDAFALASDAVTAGAAGIDFGRNVWQSAHPVATIQALRAVVHDGQGVDDALGLYERLAGQPVPAGR